MQLTNKTLIVTGLAIQQTVATGWLDASAYTCPGNTETHCSPDQQQGYAWDGLSKGAFDSYGSNKFSGFTCSDSFDKRELSKRGFQSKCITANLDDGPSMYGDAFSIDQYQITSSEDTDIEAHYGMPDGSVCKETHSCSKHGTTVKNSQCGGAKKVTFKPSKHGKKGCSIGVHSVRFHCGTPSAPPYSPSTSAAPSTSSASAPPASTSVSPQSSSAPVQHCYGGVGEDCVPSSTPVSPESSAIPVPSCYGKDCSTPSVPPSSTPVAPTSSSVATPPCYGKDCGSISSTPVSPVSSTSYPAPPESTSATPVSSSLPSYHTPKCPEVLPRCLKTWMFVTSCKNNSDHNCFCTSEKLINNVMSCLTAWGASESDIEASTSYLIGLCAAHILKNPAIITGCPSGVTPKPTGPATTITFSHSTITTTITVPKVSLSLRLCCHPY